MNLKLLGKMGVWCDDGRESARMKTRQLEDGENRRTQSRAKKKRRRSGLRCQAQGMKTTLITRWTGHGLQGETQGQTSKAGGGSSIYRELTTDMQWLPTTTRTPATAPGPPALPWRTCARPHHYNRHEVLPMACARHSKT